MEAIKKKMLSNTRLFVGLKMAEVACITPQGEVRWVVGLTPGTHYGDAFQADMMDGDSLELSGAVTCIKRGGRVAAQTWGETAYQSGANPDWRPTSAATAEKRLRKMMGELNAKQAALDKRLNALNRIKDEAGRQPDTEAGVTEPDAPEDVTPEPGEAGDKP